MDAFFQPILAKLQSETNHIVSVRNGNMGLVGGTVSAFLEKCSAGAGTWKLIEMWMIAI